MGTPCSNPLPTRAPDHTPKDLFKLVHLGFLASFTPDLFKLAHSVALIYRQVGGWPSTERPSCLNLLFGKYVT